MLFISGRWLNNNKLAVCQMSYLFDSTHIEPILNLTSKGKRSSMFEKGASAILAVQVGFLP